jgi:hypothetical protein
MSFIFSAPVIIRHLWQLKTVVYLHRCLIRAFILHMLSVVMLRSAYFIVMLSVIMMNAVMLSVVGSFKLKLALMKRDRASIHCQGIIFYMGLTLAEGQKLECFE